MIEGDDKEQELIEKQIKYFYNGNLPIHLVLKSKTKQGEHLWYNGKIKELSTDCFILDEFEDGLMPIFYLQIDRVSQYKTEGEKE